MKHPSVLAAILMQPHDDTSVSLGLSVGSPGQHEIDWPPHGPLLWRLSGEHLLGGGWRRPLPRLVDCQPLVSVEIDAARQPGGVGGSASHPTADHTAERHDCLTALALSFLTSALSSLSSLCPSLFVLPVCVP